MEEKPKIVEKEVIKEVIKYVEKEPEMRESRFSKHFTDKLFILEEFYDNMSMSKCFIFIELHKNESLSDKIPELPVYYQGVVEETEQKLNDLKRHHSKTRQSVEGDLKLHIDLNAKLSDSISQLREQKNLLNIRYASLKEKYSSVLNGKSDDSMNTLRNRNNNLETNLKYQMTATSKIDAIRQKLSDRVKQLEKEKNELEIENEDLVCTINELRVQVECKSADATPRDPSPDANFQFEKTKGTFSDKGDSHTGKV